MIVKFNMKFKKFILDKQARNYIKEIFELDDNIGKKIFKKINFDKGEVYTYLPETVNEKYIYKFELGGKIPIDKSKVEIHDGWRYTPKPGDEIIYLAKELKQNLNDEEDICILRSGWFKKEEELVSKFKAKTPLHFFGQDLYYFLYPSLSIEEIENSINEVSDLSFNIGFITKKTDKMDFLKIKESDISNEAMEFFIDNASVIFAGAYDKEGHIIWKL